MLGRLPTLPGSSARGSLVAEFAWGTLRTALIANHRRRLFGFVRSATFGALSLLLVGFLVLVAMISPAAIALTGTQLPNVSVDVPDIVAMAAASTANLWLAALVGMLSTLLVRSLQSGAIISLVALALLEAIGGALRAGAETLSELTPGQGFRLFGQLARASAFGADPIPTALPAIVMLACAIGWMIVLAVSCVELIARRDVLS